MPGKAVPACYLSQPGYPLKAAKLYSVIFRSAGEIGDKLRPWTNEGHFALQHIKELRQLVDRGVAEEAAEAGKALAVLARGFGVAVRAHRSEFQDLKGFAEVTRTPLLEEDGLFRGANLQR